MSTGLAILVAALGSSFVATIAFGLVILQHPEKVQLWAAWMWRAIRLVTRKAELRYISTDVSAHLNDQFQRDLGSQLDGFTLPTVSIRWTNDAAAIASEDAGTLIVRMRPHEARSANLFHAALAATRLIVAPTLRSELRPHQSRAIDLQLCRRLAERISDSAVLRFRMDILDPALALDADLGCLLEQFNAIDLGGLFIPVLLQELVKLSAGSPVDSLPGAAEELEGFTEFLLTVARRGAGEDVQLSYIGRYFRVNILLVARQETRAKGVGPYRARVSTELGKGVDTVYLMATGANIEFAAQVADALDADRRLIRQRPKKLVIERAGRSVRAVLVPFERNLGFATAEFFQEVVSATRLSVGAVVTGMVTEVQAAYAVLDIGGIQGVIQARDMAWHWVDDCRSELGIGDECKVRILGINVESTEVTLSRKAELPSPMSAMRDDQLIGLRTIMTVTRHIASNEATASVLGRSSEDPPLPLRLYWEEMDWGGQPHRLQQLTEGAQLPVVVIRVDRDQGLAVVSHKRLAAGKWEAIRDRYPRGTNLTLPVVAIHPNGVTCQVEAGLTGFVPESEFQQAGLEYSDFRDRLRIGETLFVYVSRAVGGAKERLNLGLQRNRQGNSR